MLKYFFFAVGLCSTFSNAVQASNLATTSALSFNQTIIKSANLIANELGGLSGKINASYSEDGHLSSVEFITRKSWHCKADENDIGMLKCENSTTSENHEFLLISPDGWNM